MSFNELNSGPMPDRPSKLFWVETLGANAKIRFTIFSKQLWQLWVHYNRKTTPCYKDRSRCQGGHDNDTLRWYGYLFGWHHSMDRAAFLQVTLGGARGLYEQIAKGVSLRGMIIDASRGGKKNARQYLRIERYQNREESLLVYGDEDPHDSLFKMWKVPRSNDRMDFHLGDGPQDLPESEKCG